MGTIRHFVTTRLNIAHWSNEITEPHSRNALIARIPTLLTQDVIAHLPPSFDVSGQDINQWIDTQDAESDVYLIREMTTGIIIGLMFLTPPYNNDIHVGYLFGRSSWGKGYASELISGLVSHLPELNGFRLLGGVGRQNAVSAHVLRKAGFKLIPELSDPETEMFGFALDAKGPE